MSASNNSHGPRAGRGHHSWLFALVRGALNATAVAFCLRQAAHPLPAALAVACTAGVQSAFLQWTPINVRYARLLSSAHNEAVRFARWGAVSTGYYVVMQLVGTLALGTRGGWAEALLAALGTSLFGVAQYPWVAAISVRRAEAERARTDGDFTADLHTMLASAWFVALSALGAIGVAASRPALVASGLAGLAYYSGARRPREPSRCLAAAASSLTMRALRS